VRLFLVLPLVSLAACSSASEEAEEQYRIVDENAPWGSEDRCTAARAVKDAYLAEGDEDEYALWHLIEAGDCAVAVKFE